MLAQKDECIRDASNTIYHLSQEEKIRLQCEAREDYYRRQGDAKLLRERLTAALESAKKELAEKDATIAALQAEIEHLKNNNCQNA